MANLTLINGSGRWTQITPGATDLAERPRALLVTATSDITMLDEVGTSMTLSAVAANTFLDLQPKRVTAASGTVWALF